LIQSEEEGGREGGREGRQGGQDVLLLLDSGAQYLDGTTDVTRTVREGGREGGREGRGEYKKRKRG